MIKDGTVLPKRAEDKFISVIFLYLKVYNFLFKLNLYFSICRDTAKSKTSVILTKEHEFLRETVKKKIFIQVKDFNAHGFVTSSTENGYSNFETVKISEESNLHTLSVSDSVKIFLKTGQYFILCKKKSFWSIFLQFFDPALKICIFWMEKQPYLF